MRRSVLILLLGLVAAAVSYCCVYMTRTSPARTLQRSDQPELAWLKEEFKLSDAEFERVSKLHVAYLPECRKMCREIETQNAKLQTLLASATNVTPEIEATLAETGRLRSECQRNMLRHFYEVSQMMPPEQGRRYFAWVKDKAFLPTHDMHEQH